MNDGAKISGLYDVECWGPGKDGKPEKQWRMAGSNLVVRGGLQYLLNVGLAGQRVTTNGPFMALHSASTNITNDWGAISASQVGGYGASWPTCSFASTNSTAMSVSASASFGFSVAGTSTLSGVCINFYTSASCATNPTAADVKMYNQALFTTSASVTNGNTISVSATLTMFTG